MTMMQAAAHTELPADVPRTLAEARALRGETRLPAAAPTVRYKLKFHQPEALDAALAMEGFVDVRAVNRRRGSVSVRLPSGPMESTTAAFSELTTQFGARVVPDYQYELEEVDFFNPTAFAAEDLTAPSLDDVLQLIRAPEAWQRSRGRNVIIAVVDTGIDGTRPEFGPARRQGSWQPLGDTPWTDWQGHGTMCASIAAGSKADGGEFDGVAPEALIRACRTRFFDTELGLIYDELADLARDGNFVIATNSFGIKTGSPPPQPEDSDFIPALDEAIAAGVKAFFSAGNYHALAGGGATDHQPTSVWLHKCRADVMTVAACKLDGSMWFYSSRGPGQFQGPPRFRDKPDVMGATPPNGRVVYGGQVRSLADGWGTSGCCPQAAGLGALLLSIDPTLDHAALFEIIRGSAVSQGHHPFSEGRGLIDCAAAVALLP